MFLHKHNIFIILFFILTLSILIVKTATHPQHFVDDCALFFYCAKKMLLGQRPYLDFIEHNPPLIYYLNLFPAFLQLSAHIPAPLAFSLFILILSILSFTLSYIILYKAQLQFSIHQSFLIALSILNLFVYETLGQREHLIILFIVPYLIIRSIRFENGKVNANLAMFSGIIAGLSLCIKPWYAVLLIVYDCTWSISTRQYKKLFAREAIFIIATILIYLLHFLLLPSDEINSYFGTILPLSISGYHATNTHWTNLLIVLLLGVSPNYSPVPKYFVFYLLVLIYLSLKNQRKNKIFLPCLSLLFASIFTYLWQGKWLDYHHIPIQYSYYLLTALNAFVFANWLVNKYPLKLLPNLSSNNLTTFITIGSITVLSPILSCYGKINYQNAGSQSILKYTKPGDYVMVLAYLPRVLPELFQRRMATRYQPEGYPTIELSYLHNHESSLITKNKLKRIEVTLLHDLINEVIKYKPQLIIISYLPGNPYLDELTYYQSIGFIDYCLKTYSILNDPQINHLDYGFPPAKFFILRPRK